MFKSLKDVKRRAVEQLMANVGASERTVDEEFDLFHQKYTAMMTDLNECGAANFSALTNQKNSFADNLILAESLHRIHDLYRMNDNWPGVESHLQAIPAAEKYKEAMSEIHNVYRSSSALTCVERAIEPLREAISTITPAIDGMVKERNTILIDYDSYRRRLKALREKKEQIEAQGKTSSTAGQENLAEITKFEGKEHVARETYAMRNATVKAEIEQAKEKHDELINNALVTIVVAQAELYSRAAKKLEEVIALLPSDQVQEVRAQIQKVVGQGGAQTVKEEKTTLQKGLMIASGKALPSDFKKDGEKVSSSNVKGRSSSMISLPNKVSSPPTPSAPPAPAAKANPFAPDGNPFTLDDGGKGKPNPPPSAAPVSRPPPPSAHPPPPPPSAPAPPIPTHSAPSPSSPKKVTVVALFDHEAEAEDELNFKAGQVVEVLETGEDGWWKGRCNGQVGLFPVNYVEVKK